MYLIEIPLGRGTIALVSLEEIKAMLLQPHNSTLAARAILRGKGQLRANKMIQRQEKAHNESIFILKEG